MDPAYIVSHSTGRRTEILEALRHAEGDRTFVLVRVLPASRRQDAAGGRPTETKRERVKLTATEKIVGRKEQETKGLGIQSTGGREGAKEGSRRLDGLLWRQLAEKEDASGTR